MSRRTSDSVKLIEQAQFTINEEKISRVENYAENLFAYSNRYGVLLVVRGSKLLACSLTEFEKDFKGGEEQEITPNIVISTKKFESDIQFIVISPESEFVAVCCQAKIGVYHMSMFADKVRTALSNLIECSSLMILLHFPFCIVAQPCRADAIHQSQFRSVKLYMCLECCQHQWTGSVADIG